jgi:hypothetical protein
MEVNLLLHHLNINMTDELIGQVKDPDGDRDSG